MQSLPSGDLIAASGLKIVTSHHFNGWLDERCLSLVFTTYQAGKIFLVGFLSVQFCILSNISLLRKSWDEIAAILT